jgi:hypothetical protein
MQSILIQKKIFLIPILSLFSISSMAQQQVQTLRGVIIDQQSKNGIDYATVSISGTNLSTTTDSIGTFIIKEVPLGRIILSVSHVGYEPRQIQNVVVVAGKETVLEIEMLESLTSQMDEVVIVHKRKITSSNGNSQRIRI